MGQPMKPTTAACASCCLCVSVFFLCLLPLLVLTAIATPGDCAGENVHPERCEEMVAHYTFDKIFLTMFFLFVGTSGCR